MPEDYPVIGEYWFRLHVDAIDHSRVVFGIVDWLGAIGGIEDVLMQVLAFFLGGYIQFNAVIQAYHYLCDG